MYYVYILTNHTKNVFYVGVTNNIKRRVSEHRKNRGIKKTFAGRYYCFKLVYYEIYSSILTAIKREKELKNLSRNKKLDLIKAKNPTLQFYVI